MTAFLGSTFLYVGILCTAGNLGMELGTPLIRNYTVEDYTADPQNWALIQDSSGVMYFGNNLGVLMFDGSRWDLVPINNHSMVNALAIDAAGRVYVGGSGEFGYLQANQVGVPTYVSLSHQLQGKDGVFGRVWNVHCTSHGVYFRAREKIFRYDGQKIEILPLLSHKRSTVFAGAVLYNGRDFGLWVLDEKGARELPKTQAMLSAGEGTIMMPFSDSELLLAVRGLGLFRYDLTPFLDEEGFRETFDPDAPGPVPWENNVENYLKEAQFYTGGSLRDGFAFGTKTGGVVITNREGRKVRVINRDGGLFCNRVRAVYQDQHANLWVALNDGLALVEINTPFSLFEDGQSSHEGVLTITDFDGDFYVGAHNGLFFLDEAGHFRSLTEGKHGFWAFFPFKGRLLTVSNEIFEIEGRQAQRLKTQKANTLTTYCLNTSPRFPDHILTGTRDGVRVVKTGLASEKPLRILEEFYVEGIHEEIRRIEPDSKGNLWLSTRYNGLIYLQLEEDTLEKGRVFRFGKQHGLPRMDNCKIVYVKGRWRVATQEGIYRLAQDEIDLENPESLRFEPDPDFAGFDGRRVRQIFEDKDGRIWVAATQKMGYFSPEEDGTFSWNQQPFMRFGDGLLHVAGDGAVWIDAPLGLYRYTGGTNPVAPRSFQTRVSRVTANDELVYGGFAAGERATSSWPTLTMPRDIIGGAVSFAYSATFYENSESNRYRYFLEGYDKDWSDWSKETYTNYTNLAGGTYRFKVESKNLYEQLGNMALIELVIPKPWYHTNVAYLIFGLGLFGLLVGVVWFTSVFQKKRHELRRQFDLKQQELQKFEALGRLAGGIAHDFNGILATIYGFTHRIEKATRNLPGLTLPFDEIEKAGQRGEDLVNQILAFSRGEKPKNKLLDASMELHKALDLAQITLPPKVTLVRCIDPDAGWLRGDPTRCHQVILNLFRNAVQALNDQPGTIEVGLDRKSGLTGEACLHIWVKDSGEGMDAKTRDHLFEPFYTNRSRGEGTGLGLWVVHSIITAMGGTISVVSEPGRGALFEMLFKRESKPITQEELRIEHLPEGQGQGVLWIDNSQQRLREGTLLLRNLHYKAIGALIDEYPLADLERDPHAIDLIVVGCDELPCKAQTLLARIRKLRADIPVICCVSDIDQDFSGFQGRLETPLAPKRLARLVFETFAIRTSWDRKVIT